MEYGEITMVREGETNEQGEVLLLDKWANEGGKRVRAWRLEHGDVRIEFCEVRQGGDVVYAALTLASYRADDLMKAMQRTSS